MSNITNPFTLHGYVGPEYFCDREAETAQLKSALRNGRNVTLMSHRRMGKTGLIHNTFHQIRQESPEVACFYIDIFSTKTLTDFVGMLGKAIMGKVDSPMQKAIGTIAAFLKTCRIVFTADPHIGHTSSLNRFQSSRHAKHIERHI